MEMGQPPAVQNADPAMWVRSRQYTGRVVTVSNARVFDEPVPYSADAARAEEILFEAARRHTVCASRPNIKRGLRTHD